MVAAGLGREGLICAAQGGPLRGAAGAVFEAEDNHDPRCSRGAAAEEDGWSLITSFVLGRQNQAEAESKKMKIIIPRSDPADVPATA